MKNETIKGIILDFDGTLADSEPTYYRANRDAFRLYGHEIDAAEYYHHWSLLGEGSIGEVERHGLVGIDLEQVRKVSRQNYLNLVQTEGIRLFDGVKLLLEDLAAHGYSVVIASNTRKDIILHILTDAGYTTIPVPVIGGDGLSPKPAPDIFLKACDFLQLEPQQCMVLEDTDKGVRAARSAGIPFGVIHSPLYPDFNPSDAVQKFQTLQAFYDFLTGDSTGL